MLSCVPLFATPQAVACQALLSIGFPRQEYWSGLPVPPPGHLPSPGIETTSLADSLPLIPPGKPQVVKNLPAMQETWVQSLGWEDPLEKVMATHSSIPAGEFHRQRSQAGYSPWGLKASDMAERLALS